VKYQPKNTGVFKRFRIIAKNDYKLRHASLPACLSVRPSIRMEQPGFRWTDVHLTLFTGIFRKSVEKSHILLKFDKNKEYFT